ncbi:MAG: hypothetical protein EBR82_14925 [Caulobacteraceae bacterium]|nr:hypothetical protein [Caulobacteraceae bacterium]
MTTETIVFQSVARRLEAGTYQPRAKAPSSPVASLPPSPWAMVAPYLGSAILGAFMALCFTVQP